VAAGLALGPDTGGIAVNLNYQLLPVLLKAIMRPFLGTASVTNAADPFADPTSVAFPANPILIGGLVGVVITSLSLMPIGRLDGGVLSRLSLGSAAGALGLVGWAVLLTGSFAPDDAGALALSFGIATILWNNGTELPPKEGTTDISEGQKAFGIVLLAVGLSLSIPGFLFPSV